MDAPEGEIGGIADSICRRHVEPIPVLGCEGPYRRFSVPYKSMRSGSDEAESSSQDRSRLSGARTEQMFELRSRFELSKAPALPLLEQRRQKSRGVYARVANRRNESSHQRSIRATSRV